MIYFIIGVVLLILVIIVLKKSKKGEKQSKPKEYHIYSYVVMEEEDEDLFDEADNKLWELAETYPFLHPGQIFCRIDRDQVIWNEDWDELIIHTNYSKEKVPYYLLLSEEITNKKNSPKINWETKVLETNDVDEIRKWCASFEKQIFKEHDSYINHVGG